MTLSPKPLRLRFPTRRFQNTYVKFDSDSERENKLSLVLTPTAHSDFGAWTFSNPNPTLTPKLEEKKLLPPTPTQVPEYFRLQLRLQDWDKYDSNTQLRLWFLNKRHFWLQFSTECSQYCSIMLIVTTKVWTLLFIYMHVTVVTRSHRGC